MSAMALQINDVSIFLLHHLFRHTSEKISKHSVTGEFPAERASNAENVSIWWRDHAES